MYFSNIIFIGSGSLLLNCLKFTKANYSQNIRCIETEKTAFSNLNVYCNSNNTPYLLLTGKEEKNNFFQNITSETLVLSIHNNYIFTSNVLANESLTIINFHNSLLPKHPGRNAPSWAIYDLDMYAGITWHEVVTEIDKGAIILQKQILLDTTFTGIKLTQACVKLGFESFKEHLPSFLEKNYLVTPQPQHGNIKIHYASDVPNDGIFNVEWPLQKQYAFLRSLDYGSYPVFPKAKIQLQNTWYHINKYQLVLNSKQCTTNNLVEAEVVAFKDDQSELKLYLTTIN